MINLILFVCSIIFFISGNIVLSWNYYKVNQEKYNYFNHFPFELILTRKLNFYFLGLIFYILSYFASIAIIFTMIANGLDLNQQSFFCLLYCCCCFTSFNHIPIFIDFVI